MQEIEIREIEIKVKGLMCTGCENRVKAALSLFDFVEKVQADHKLGIVKVEIKEDADITELYEAIEDLGFECVKED